MERPQSITRASQSPRLVSIEHENYTTTPPQKYTAKNWVPLWVLIRIPKPQNEEYLVRYICTIKNNPEKPSVPVKIPLVPIKISLNRQHFSISWPAGVVTLGLSHLDIARLERLEGDGHLGRDKSSTNHSFGRLCIYIYYTMAYIYSILWYIYILYYGICIYIYILFPVFLNITVHFCFQLYIGF